MPFKSKAQEKWAFANHMPFAKAWVKITTDYKNLPEKKKKSPKNSNPHNRSKS